MCMMGTAILYSAETQTLFLKGIRIKSMLLKHGAGKKH